MNYPHPSNFKFNDVDVFYNNGAAAMVLGRFRDWDGESLGMRWMVGSPNGFPTAGEGPVWMIVPDGIALHILEGLHYNASKGMDLKAIINHAAFDKALECFRRDVGPDLKK